MYDAGLPQEEEKWGIGNKTGFLVSLDDVSVEVTTRAASEKFNLVVTKEGITKPFEETTLTSGSSTFVEVSAGTYNIKATSTSWDEKTTVSYDPYYVAEEKDVEITESDTQKPIELKAEYGCALASVNFPEGLKDIFKEYEVAVKVGGNTAYLRTSDDRVYIKAGEEVTLSFRGTKLNGEEITPQPLTDEKLPSTFDAKDSYIITLMMGDGLTMDISKVEEKTVEITEEIPLEWLPKPKMEATGFDDNNNLTFVETETKTAKLNLDLSSALQDIKFKFDFQDEQFESLQKDKEYLLSNAEDKAAIEAALGVTLPNVGDETGAIDFSALVAKMQTNAGTPTINAVEVDVKANNRWSSEVKEGDEVPNLKYTFTCNKPEFSVAVQPGNMWTKTFTIDEPTVMAGNADVLKEKLVYQYREKGADDNAWQNCNNGLEQVFSTQPDKKEYEVRAYYREGIVSEVVDVELESPEQLPNSDMEEWWIETKKASGVLSSDKTYYTFHPYTEGGGNSSWWSTNNDKAQGGTVALNIWYEGCFASCVSYTEDVHEGSKAALIYLSGCGDGYANTSGTYVGGAMVGSLFIGTYNSGIVQGHSFESRPSSLSFWYKYKPYNSDAFKVVISLKNGDKEIATGTYEPTAYSAEDNVYKQATVNFNYTDNSLKATTICVQFLASNKTSLSEGDFEKGTTINYPVIGNWTVHMGSVLKIDDLNLNYDK